MYIFSAEEEKEDTDKMMLVFLQRADYFFISI
jgi:hypothetical protein